jgi:puromycin-sensitive aminopeptidase
LHLQGATQFEAVDARQAFPCWDEPAFKSTFELTLIIPRDLRAISNMPVASTSPRVGFNTEGKEEERTCVKFQRTPVMSTYVLAWCVGQFESVTSQSASGLPVTVYTPVGRAAQGRFSLDTACRCLDAYQTYFSGIPYPLPKLDLVSIADFGILFPCLGGVSSCFEL